MMNDEDFIFDPYYYVSIAKDLCYGEEYIEKLKRSKSHIESERIMADARHHMSSKIKSLRR